MYHKKIYTFFIYIVSILVLSCEEDQTKKYQDNALVLKKEIASKDSIIQTLSNSTKITSKKVDSLETLIKNNYTNKDYLFFLFKHQNLFINKETVVTSIISRLELDKTDIMPELFNFSFFYKAYDTDAPHYNLIPDKDSAISALWNNADRSPEAIKTFLTEKDKYIITNIFNNNSIYKDTGLYAIVKALITSYDEIESNEHFKQEILELKLSLYKVELDSDLDIDDYSELRAEQEKHIENLSSDTVTNILSDENYSAYPETSSAIENRLFLIYSFWARRHKEGNQEVVYDLIKELHSKITNENFEEEKEVLPEPELLDNEYEG